MLCCLCHRPGKEQASSPTLCLGPTPGCCVAPRPSTALREGILTPSLSMTRRGCVDRSSKVTPLHGPEDRLLPLPAVAERLGCSRGLVRRLDAEGVLPRVRLGRLVRYRASDVSRLVTEGWSRGCLAHRARAALRAIAWRSSAVNCRARVLPPSAPHAWNRSICCLKALLRARP